MRGDTLAAIGQAAALAGVGLFAFAAAQDVAVRRVDNAVPLAVAAVALAWRGVQGDLLQALGSAFLVFVAAALCWRRGWLGGADAKLFGAGSLLVSSGFAFVLATTLAGGVLACLYWLLGRVLGRADARDVGGRVDGLDPDAGRLCRVWRVERRRLRRGGPLPYAVALFAGLVFALAEG